VRERFGDWSLLELDLVTGRTHQLRVHLASIGHPIAGDPLYATGAGAARTGRLGAAVPALVAHRVHVAHGERLVRAEAPLPAELEAVLGRPARRRGAMSRRERAWRAGAQPPPADLRPAGAMVIIISGPSGVGKDTVCARCASAIPIHGASSW
jgi:hypothetical protein